jgi:outer membrane autotransporter protein
MNNQFFVSGQGSYGGGDNIKKLRRTGDLLDHTASGTTKGRVTGGKVEVGYDYKIEKFSVSVVPTAGIAYNSVNVKGYRETGEGINRKISKRTTSKTSALFGIMTKYEALSGDFALVPEVHANVNYIINSKNSDTQITIIDNIPPMTTPAAKLPKLKYTIGTSIKLIEYKYFNTEIGYDLGLAKKFTSHTGLISFRAEF